MARYRLEDDLFAVDAGGLMTDFDGGLDQSWYVEKGASIDEVPSSNAEPAAADEPGDVRI